MSLEHAMIHLITESSSTTGCHTRDQRQPSNVAVIRLGGACGSHETNMVLRASGADAKKPRWGEPGFRKRTDRVRGKPVG
jgi:hypothetical protein